MKKVLKTVLIVLVVLIIVLGVVAYLNRGNIKAFLMAYTASEEELQNKLDSNGVDNKVLSDYDITLRDLTEEEKSKLANNEISEEDAVAIIMGMLDPSLPTESTEGADEQPEAPEKQEQPVDDEPIVQTPSDDIPVTEKPTVENKPEEVKPNIPSVPAEAPEPSVVPDKPAETEKEPVSDTLPEDNKELSEEQKRINKEISELVAKIYVVRARVMSTFDAYIEELKVEYDADRTLTKEERRATKPQFAARAIKVVAKWEKECDTEINAILSEIETLLKDSGQSLELVDTIRKAYEDEKAAKKAYCINQYLD